MQKLEFLNKEKREAIYRQLKRYATGNFTNEANQKPNTALLRKLVAKERVKQNYLNDKDSN